LDCGLGKLPDLLLHKHGTPEFKLEPIEVGERFAQTGTFERVEPEIGYEWPINLLGCAKPPVRLIGKPPLEVADPCGRKGTFGEGQSIVALRRPLDGEEVRLVVTVGSSFVGRIATLVAGFHFNNIVGVSPRRKKSGEPAQPRHDGFLTLARRYLAGPS